MRGGLSAHQIQLPTLLCSPISNPPTTQYCSIVCFWNTFNWILQFNYLIWITIHTLKNHLYWLRSHTAYKVVNLTDHFYFKNQILISDHWNCVFLLLISQYIIAENSTLLVKRGDLSKWSMVVCAIRVLCTPVMFY